MAGPRQRRLHGKEPGWTGPMRNHTPVVVSDATLFEPPLRLLVATGAGTVVLVLDGDDETNVAHRFTLTLAAGQTLDKYAIRQVRAASTATGLLGFR